MLSVLDTQGRLRDVPAISVLHSGELREVLTVVGIVNGELRILWRKRKDEQTGWVFTQGHPISVSGRFIRLLGQQ